MHGKEWQKVQQHVHTRTSTQARSHAQKFFVKLDKKQLTLDDFLDRLDIEQLKVDLKLGDAGDSTEYDEDQPLITIANQKNKGSVMNIALPGENFKYQESEHIQEYPPEDMNYHQDPQEEHYKKMESIKEESIMINEIAISNMKLINTEDKKLSSSKRNLMQRKAKMNHAFFGKNYLGENIPIKESIKRRKVGNEEEVIVKCESDTKIKLNSYAIQDVYDEPSKDHQYIQENEEFMHNQHTENDIYKDDLQQFEKEMQANSELDEI